MTRSTSIAMYRHIQANGILNNMMWLVYDTLYRHGPLTRSELDLRLKRGNEVNPSYHKRLSELEDWGAVQVLGTRICSVTGNETLLWDVTANLPRKPPPKMKAGRLSKVELQEAVAELYEISVLLARQGRVLGPELQKTYRWLHAKSGFASGI